MSTRIDDLKEWCLRYQEWKDICENLKLSKGIGRVGTTQEWHDYTYDSAYIREHLAWRVEVIEDCCDRTDVAKASDILLAVTEDIPPAMLGVSDEMYGRFFDVLKEELWNYI